MSPREALLGEPGGRRRVSSARRCGIRIWREMSQNDQRGILVSRDGLSVAFWPGHIEAFRHVTSWSPAVSLQMRCIGDATTGLVWS